MSHLILPITHSPACFTCTKREPDWIRQHFIQKKALALAFREHFMTRNTVTSACSSTHESKPKPKRDKFHMNSTESRHLRPCSNFLKLFGTGRRIRKEGMDWHKATCPTISYFPFSLTLVAQWVWTAPNSFPFWFHYLRNEQTTPKKKKRLGKGKTEWVSIQGREGDEMRRE